jgi:hypothetical protein
MIFKCGKLEHVWDSRTIQFANFMTAPVRPPTRFDFDKGRTEFPQSSWGSNKNKCDVIASQANQLLRFGRIDEKRTIPLADKDVIRRYRTLARVSPGQEGSGLSVLYAMKMWQQKGWTLRGKNYKIELYGEIDPRERELLRSAIYLFKGVHMGFWLPRAVDGLGTWDYVNEVGEIWKPGSLGGTLAYCKAYNEKGYQLIYEGRSIFASNEFVEHFSDECWICIESIDYWVSQALDIEKLSVLLPDLSTPHGKEE